MPSSHDRGTKIDMTEVLANAQSPSEGVEHNFVLSSPHIAPRKDFQGDNNSRHSKNTLGISVIHKEMPPGPVRSVVNDTFRLRATRESPWNKYERIYETEFSSTVLVAIRKALPMKLVHVRKFSTTNSARALPFYQTFQHPNIVRALEAFTMDDDLYIVIEHMPISLEWIVRSPAYPNERELAAILGQVVGGIDYLAAEGFDHQSLNCSNILLNTRGDVKIANQECCQAISNSRGQLHGIKALPAIIMQLMQKYEKEDGVVGIDNLHRWPSSSDALAFLSATLSAISPVELLKHPLLNRPYQKECLTGIISLAQVSIRGRYRYSDKRNFEA